jgi:hypothetical protein
MELFSYYFFTVQIIKDVWIHKHTEIQKIGKESKNTVTVMVLQTKTETGVKI